MILDTLVLALVAIAVELLLGACACTAVLTLLSRARTGNVRARRRLRAVWARAGQALRGGIPAALGLLGTGVAAHLAGTRLGGGRSMAFPWLVAGGLLTFGTVSTTGCYLLLHAARLDARGRMRAARREARLGGFLLPSGVIGLLALVVVVALLGLPALRAGAALAALAALGALTGSGIVGLLCGLSGKARPSAGFAALLYLTGLILFFAASRPA